VQRYGQLIYHIGHYEKYNHLAILERETLAYGLIQGKSLGNIAKSMGRDKSTLSREIARTMQQGTTYSALSGHYFAKLRGSVVRKRRKIENNPDLQEYVHKNLRLRWSPEQIARRLRIKYPHDKTMHISRETIYTYLYVLPRGELKAELLSYLRQKQRSRRKRTKAHSNRGQIIDMISIEERPKEIENRTIPGHWEGDLIVGKNRTSALGTLVERTTRTTILVPLTKKDAPAVRRAFARETRRLPQQMKLSLTYDRGKEMAEHKLFTKQTKIKVYFAHPQSPWERGTNENTNGLIRQYFPKGTDFNKVTRKQIKRVQDQLNGRPRKVLDFQTPYEVFSTIVALET